MTLEKLLKDFKGAETTLHPNYMKIPATRIDMNEVGAEQFNEIYFAAKEYFESTLTRTSSGGICLRRLRIPSWDVRMTTSCVEMTLLMPKKMYRIQFRSRQRELDQMASGRRAFTVFKRVLQCKYNIDIEKYAIQNGKDVKKEIENPLIGLTTKLNRNRTFENVHHVDFRSSYPAGAMNHYPELAEPIQYMFDMRKKKEIYKAVLDYTIGFMQSKNVGWRFSHIARDAIHDNNVRVKELARRFERNGATILMYNTDGFWFIGDQYHGKGEGDNIGQWHYDHINCQWRAKSDGCYEFIEDGKYHPVVRGRTKYDSILPREEWSWGDIYRNDCEAIKWIFDFEKGVYADEEKEN